MVPNLCQEVQYALPCLALLACTDGGALLVVPSSTTPATLADDVVVGDHTWLLVLCLLCGAPALYPAASSPLAIPDVHVVVLRLPGEAHQEVHTDSLHLTIVPMPVAIVGIARNPPVLRRP